MTDLRTAAKQALEALAAIDKDFKSHGRQHWPEAVKARDAIPALRAALADGDKLSPSEPVQEPYAWMSVGGSIWRHKTREDDVPLYTAPPQRKPLAEWQINDLMDQIPREDIDSWSFRQGVYAAEKHHGIRS